jgi:hypothetical protein
VLHPWQEREDEFNFLRASCGLDASIRIYAKRVDSTFEVAQQSLFGIKGVRPPAGVVGSGVLLVMPLIPYQEAHDESSACGWHARGDSKHHIKHMRTHQHG